MSIDNYYLCYNFVIKYKILGVNSMNFNEIIQELREDLEPPMSQTKLGEELKITQRKVSYLENGKIEPNIEDIIRYCKFFEVSADYLLGMTKDKRKFW